MAVAADGCSAVTALPQLWGQLRMPDIAALRDAGAVVLLPAGAIEQHGSHLPLDTDISGAYRASMAVAASRHHVVVAPPVWWGLSSAHRGFPGLLSLRPETFIAVLEDLCESMLDQGFRKIALVIAHGSNKPAAALVVQNMMRRHKLSLLQVNYLELAARAFAEHRRSAAGGEYHAGELETSLQLHLREELVDVGAARAHLVDPVRDIGHSAVAFDIFGGGQASLGFDLLPTFASGVMGDPTVASAATGRVCFDAAVERLGAIVDEYHGLQPPEPGRANAV